MEVICLLYCWIWNYPVETIIHELSISSKTYTSYTKYFRELCCMFSEMYKNDIIGGDWHVVQIDEICIGKRKYNIGRLPAHSQKWFFGGIDLETKNVFYVYVPNRKSETLLEKIQEHIHPGSIIMSDGWKGYNTVGEKYDHATVNHHKEFVEQNLGINTQTIEAINSCVRKLLKRNGTHLQGKHLNLYFGEYVWRKKNAQSNDVFETFLFDWAALIKKKQRNIKVISFFLKKNNFDKQYKKWCKKQTKY